jgi:Rrf2 family iron-sulfur cluster assembly transcriptional regulator
MRMPTKDRHAFSTMLGLGLHQDEVPVALLGVSAPQHISIPCLEPQLAQLLHHGLVKSIRGPGGWLPSGQGRLGHEKTVNTLGQ